PLGTHRLRDLAAKETILQLVIPRLPSEFPPPNTLDVAFRRGARRAATLLSVVVLIVSALALVALDQARRATDGQRILRRERYAAQMSVAQQAWEVGNVERALA